MWTVEEYPKGAVVRSVVICDSNKIPRLTVRNAKLESGGVVHVSREDQHQLAAYVAACLNQVED